MPVRVVPGEIGSKDVTTRIVVPTPDQPRWPPFDRVAETIATPRRPFPPHQHSDVEVLTYVIEGSASYLFGHNAPDSLLVGSVRLLTARAPVSHAINPDKGRTIRLFSLVVTLPPGASGSTTLQSGQVGATEMQPDGTVLRNLVGPRSALHSAAGLECEGIEFIQDGTAFRRIGHDRVAVIYALSGSGMIDNEMLEAGEAALVDDAAGVALKGEPGFSVILSTAPRASKG